MEKNTLEIIKPAVFVDMNSYWAMHFCSILETLYDQKTIEHGFQKSYMGDVFPSLRNLTSRAGFAFFNSIKMSVQNFGLQSLLCHYLTSAEGWPVFSNIMVNISNNYNYDFMGLSTQYGVFISGKDFQSGSKFISDNNPELLGYNSMTHAEAAEKVAYADLCFLLRGEERNFAVLGEVEGNHGQQLVSGGYWEKKNGLYYSFGIGVRRRNQDLSQALSGQQKNPPVITGGWVNTSVGNKYVVMIDSDHSVVQDFYNAVGTIQLFMTMGADQRANYDPVLYPILNVIKQNWDGHILDLLQYLRGMLKSNEAATLGVNPLPAKVVPSIMV
ncbi:hypothetical protein SAMN03159304_03122 [Pseudomonas sp. NFACC24-1]|uniref:hypothetical protein n=1 Tax=Pseudomonas sp. NFACC24-1 TaxID=1566189 RepID=UPI0008EE7F3B|nr:hypothetical protein [Pseudomonas sp. NFACC24-1]SFO39880.1 hypothetical protein SAMN03159304_03122 [Pseudomonas sp. NFACC24-1]